MGEGRGRGGGVGGWVGERVCGDGGACHTSASSHRLRGLTMMATAPAAFMAIPVELWNAAAEP